MIAVAVLVRFGVDQKKLRRLVGIHFRPGLKKQTLSAPSKSRGAPVKWSDEAREALRQIVDDEKGILKRERKKASDKAALQRILIDYANDLVETRRRDYASEHLKALQNQLAIARKRIPKNPGN